MPTLADVRKALEGLEGGSDLISVVDGELSKLRNGEGKYRTRAKALGDYLGIDPATEDLEGALEAHKAKAKQNTANGKPDPEWDARLKRLEGELESERKRRTEAEASARTSKAQAAIKDALAKAKALRPDDLAHLHMGAAKYREDGSVYFLDAAGAERSVEEHVSGWLKDRPDLVSSNQSPGPGGNGNRAPAAGLETFTRSFYRENKSNPAVMEKIVTGKAVIVDG